MKISKIHSIGLSLLFALGLGATSCQDDFDNKTPQIKEPVAEHQANMTILEFKQAYWPKTEDGNYDTSVTDFAVEVGNHPTLPEEHIYVSGRVISSDQAGNIYKSLVLQDATAALAFSINQYDLYLKYPVGQEVVVDLTGLYAGMYRGLFQIGMPSESNGKTSCSFLPDELFKLHAERNGAPDPTLTKVLTLENVASLGSSPDDLMLHQSQLVRVNDVKFELAGQAQFASYKNTEDRTLLDSYGNTMVVRTSGYSNFWQNTLPADNFDIEGIMGYYTSGSTATWQMLLNDYAGIMNVGNPSATPGSSKNPFTVTDWIEKVNADEAVSGWVSGYIVGAVALGVTEITSDSDIEWTATPLAPNTLVIGVTPTTKTLDQAIVIELPQGSDLRNFGNLAAHPELYGKEISVVGIGGKVLGTAGVTGNTGTVEEFSIEGLNVGPVEGDGSETNPYSCAQVIAMNPSSTTEAVETGIWVSGYIVGSIPTGGASTNISGTVFGLTDAAASNLVIAPSSSCTDYTKCVAIQLVSGSAVRTALNLASNPDNLGKLVSLKGDVMKYCGGPGLKNTSEYKMDGSSVTPTPGPSGDPKGTGTKDDPYNAAMALQVATGLAADTPTEEVYVSGIVSSVTEISTSFGNGTFYISDDGSKTGEFLIYRAYYLDGEKFTSEDQVKVGDKVVVLGKLVNFKGNTPEMTQGGKIVSIESNGDNPTPPGPSGDNSLENPYTVAKAQEIIASGSYTTDKVYISGIISQIDEVSMQYGNAGYYISDNGTTTGQLQVFRGYYLNGDKFTSEDQIKVGDKVIILGVLTSYNGKPQVNTGSQIVRLNGEGGNDDPTPDPTPGTDPITATSADFNTFNGGVANTMSYGTYKTAQGWTADWALILAGGAEATNFISSDSKFLFPCIDGTPARPGKLTSPLIAGGIKKLTFNYGFPYNETKVKFTVNIKQDGNVVATETVTVDSPEKGKVYTFTKGLNVTGNFVIEIVNDKYSQATVNNKDRVAIWDMNWEN